MYWFVSDEHYYHNNIIKICNRPVNNIYEMHQLLINNHNEVVSKNDIVIHGGDTSFGSYDDTMKIINKLNGTHYFIKGSHDKWLGKISNQIWEKTIEGQHIVVCHYIMLQWPRSHYGSWQLYGHSHKRNSHPMIGKQHNICVDLNNFYPISFNQIKDIMKTKPNNYDLLPKEVIKHRQGTLRDS